MTNKQLISGSVIAALAMVAGLLVGRALRDTSQPRLTDLQLEALEERAGSLSRQLEIARDEATRWKTLAERVSRTPIAPEQASVEFTGLASAGQPGPDRDADAIRKDLAESTLGQDGRRLLKLLAELSSLGPAHYPEVAADWIRLIDMEPSELDALGLSRIDLASALAGEGEMIRFALNDPELDPDFRQFAAETLSQASVTARRAILDTLDFSTERDSRVLTPLVAAARDARDPIFVDRFLHLVQRTDLYNNMRSSIAFMIAEIEGDAASRALDVLRSSGGYQRTLPVLENIHSPPATGLLVTNGVAPATDRIGHNDIILEYNGRAIRSSGDLTLADAKTTPGDQVPVRVLRDGAEQMLYVTVTNTAPGHLHFDARPIVKKM